MSQDTEENYANWLQIKGLSNRTIQEYLRYYALLDKSSISQEYIEEYIRRHNNQVARSFLNSYFNFYKSSNFQESLKDIIRKIILPKVSGRRKKNLPDIVTESEIPEIEKVLNYEKYRIMLLLCFYCGLRDCELVGEYAIKPYSFQWDKWLKDPLQVGILKVLGKGKKHRFVVVPTFLMARIHKWITEEVAKTQKKDDNLFNIGDRRWRKVLEIASQRSLGRHVNPHLLRHSCSIWLKQHGFDVNDRREYLGHEHISTTVIYDRVDTTDLMKKYPTHH